MHFKNFKKNIFIVLLIMLFNTNNLFSQNKFTLEIIAPDYINQTIQIAPLVIYEDISKFYKFKLRTKNKIIEKRNSLTFDAYKIRIQKENIIVGESMLPMAVSFIIMDSIKNKTFVTAPFFLETGHIKINLPKISSFFYDLNINTPLNVELRNFKKIFSDLYVENLDSNYNHLYPFWDLDSLTSMPEKQKRIIDYIKNNPNSYLPLWECIDDYVKNISEYKRDLESKNNITEIKNSLPFFSTTIKQSDLYKEFLKYIKIDSLDLIEKIILYKGLQIPEMKLNSSKTISNEDFKNYKLTFIDFWATWCKPCIKAFPQMVELYKEYKDKGVNIISIAEETNPKKIKLANNILKKYKVPWKNYFDKYKYLENNIHYESIHLQILVDKNGKILVVDGGDTDSIKQAIENYLNNNY